MKWYEKLYENFGKNYKKEVYVQETQTEVDFIEKEIGFDKKKRILDVGCGTGRHSIELARRGYDVVGLDLSESMLQEARQDAKQENLDITFVQANACDFNFDEKFDVVMILCEGGFSLVETDEMDYQILKNISNSLKENGLFILETGNALFPVTHPNDDAVFSLETFREVFDLEFEDDAGIQHKIKGTQRYYTCPELRWLLKSVGFNDISFFGGRFDKTEVTKDDFNMLIIAKK